MLKTSINSIQPEGINLYGIFRGVIERRYDPLMAGRCKIRVIGIHTKKTIADKTGGIPTEDLPWAIPAMPITESSSAGIGSFSVPMNGSHVFIFFENGNIMHPVYFAAAPGIIKGNPDQAQGFSDEDSMF